jgi:tetratricopeptide (TPR) repeat protein
MAYRKLGIAMGNANTIGVQRSTALERRAVFDKAYQFRDRMTERERLLTTAGYHGSGPSPDRGRMIESYEAVLRRFPDDGPSMQNMAQALEGRREFARAESLFLRRIEIDSTVQFSPFSVINAQLYQGKLEAAKASLARATRLFPGHERIGLTTMNVTYYEGQVDSFASIVRQYMRDSVPVVRSAKAGALRDLNRRRGNVAEAERLWREFRAGVPGSGGDALQDSLAGARAALWFFDRPDELLQRIDRALRAIPLSSLAPGNRPYRLLIQLYAAAGRADRARALLAEFDATITDTVQRRLDGWMLEEARARIAMAENRYREAIDLFRASEQRPDGPRTACVVCRDPEIGFAFDRLDMADSTIAVYEHFVNAPNPGRWNQDGWELPRILRRLGELYEAKGDREKATSYYQRFVTEWKDADPELQPRVTEIRERLKRLADPERR